MEIRTGGYNINDAVGESNKKTEKPGSPSVDEVNRFHDNDDVDGSAFAHHHTLGSRSTQAAAGNHRHDGTDSAALFSNLHDYYNKYETPSWMNGISIPQGLLVDVYDSSTRTVSGSGTIQLVTTADDPHSVIAGHTYLLMTEFDARLSGGTGSYYMIVRFPANRWERPPNPPGSPSVAPPPILPPTASSLNYCTRPAAYLEPRLGGVYNTHSVVNTYTPQYNGIFYPGMSIELTSGSLDVRRISLRVIDLGRVGMGNHGTNYLLTQIVRELRKMGSDITILGAIDHDYHT